MPAAACGRPSGTSIWLSATSARSASSGGCVDRLEGVGLEAGVAVDAGLAVLDLEDDVGQEPDHRVAAARWCRPARIRAGRCSSGPRRASGRCRPASRGRRRRAGTGSAPAPPHRPRRSAGTHLRQPSFIARSWCRGRALVEGLLVDPDAQLVAEAGDEVGIERVARGFGHEALRLFGAFRPRAGMTSTTWKTT